MQAIAPALVCAVCPACLTTYAKVFSSVGVGFGLSEAHHLGLMAVAVTASVGLSAWRTHRTGRRWPLGFALVGAAAIIAGHLSPTLHLLEWLGVSILLVGGLTEHFRLRMARGARPGAAPAALGTEQPK